MASSPGRRGALVLGLAGLLALGFLVFNLRSSDSSEPNSPVVIIESPMTTAPSMEETAPAAKVQQIHRALHALGKICKSPDATNQTALARPSVEAIVDFARRYPNARFAIDDETGTTVALLLVAREALRTCAPALIPQISQTLPSQYQSMK